MRRREARNETPITMAEVDMNDGEIRECKSLVMCFLSGTRGDDEPKEKEKGVGKRGRDDATSRYVDRFQHDPKNHSDAYHYRASRPSKKGQSGIEKAKS